MYDQFGHKYKNPVRIPSPYLRYALRKLTGLLNTMVKHIASRIYFFPERSQIFINDFTDPFEAWRSARFLH